MGLLETIIEAIIAIFLVIVFFFIILPQIATITGYSPVDFGLLGILFIILILLNIVKEIWR